MHWNSSFCPSWKKVVRRRRTILIVSVLNASGNTIDRHCYIRKHPEKNKQQNKWCNIEGILGRGSVDDLSVRVGTASSEERNMFGNSHNSHKKQFFCKHSDEVVWTVLKMPLGIVDETSAFQAPNMWFQLGSQNKTNDGYHLRKLQYLWWCNLMCGIHLSCCLCRKNI